MSKQFIVLAVAVLLFTRCGMPVVTTDAGVDAGQMTADASTELDAGELDSGTPDAGEVDGGLPDAGEVDAGEVDAGLDAGEVDAGQVDAGVMDAGVPDAGPANDGGFQRIRLMCANLTAGTNQNYNTPPGDIAPGPGIRIMQGAHPDIVMAQEFRYGSDDDAGMQAMTQLVLDGGMFVREIMDSAGDIPNGVMSRWPIIAAGEWQDSQITNRDYLWAQIDIPGPKDLWVISVHLSTTLNKRTTEATELVSNVMSMIPAGDYVALGGDTNADTVTEALFTTFSQVFVINPQPTDQFGNPGTNTNRYITLADGGWDPMRNKPYDWVMPSPNLQAYEVPIVITDGVNTINQPNGLIIDTRVFDGGNIGLISPALVTDSAALNMQHMGVIRDFDIPLN